MADPPQQQQNNGEKSSFFIDRYLQARNWVVRHIPGIRRGRFGRFEIKGQPHPLEYELEGTWLKKNEHMMDTPLRQIEGGWDEQGLNLGASKQKANLMKGYLGDPNGITTLYRDFTVYAGEHERIEDEVNWFREGTGYKERDEETELPGKEIWEKYGWRPDEVQKLLRNR